MTRAFGRALRNTVVLWALCAALFLYVANGLAIPGIWDGPRPADPTAVEQYNAPSIPERLAAAHDCWTGGEGHPIPGHAIITRDAHRGPEYVGGPVVGKALEQALGMKDHGLTVYAFCP